MKRVYNFTRHTNGGQAMVRTIHVHAENLEDAYLQALSINNYTLLGRKEALLFSDNEPCDSICEICFPKKTVPETEVSQVAIDLFHKYGIGHPESPFRRKYSKTTLIFDRISFSFEGNNCLIKAFWNNIHVYTMVLKRYDDHTVYNMIGFEASMPVTMTSLKME